MANYNKNTPGPPVGGWYVVGDTVTDSLGTSYEAIFTGSPDSTGNFWAVDATPMLAGPGETGITAFAGGGQTNATLLSLNRSIHIVGTVATIADSVKLPVAVGSGALHIVKNAAANSMQLFGTGTDTIDGAAAATGIAVAGGTGVLVCDYAAGLWTTVKGS